MNPALLLLVRFLGMIFASGCIGVFGYLFLVSFFSNSFQFDDLSELIAISISLGVALVILMIAGMNIAGIPLSRVNWVFLPIFIGVSVLGIRNTIPYRVEIFSTYASGLKELRFTLSFVLFLFLARTLQTHDIFVPNWVDGLIHALRLQKSILRDAFSFDNVYPGGFYSLSLLLYKFHAGTLPEVILMSGQGLAVVASLNFLVLMRRYFGRSMWGYVSSFVYSFALLFPSHLLMWGRYPFLLGLTLVPPAILVTADWVSGRSRMYVLAFIFAASLVLSHYSAFIIWLSFVFIQLVFSWRNDKEHRNQWLRLFLLLAPMVLILLPKLLNLMNRPDILSGMITRSSSQEFEGETQTILNLILKHDWFFFVLWGVAGIHSLFRKDGKISSLVVWPAIILLGTWMQYTILGYSVTSYVNWMIFVSMPIAFSCGYLAQVTIPVLKDRFLKQVDLSTSHLVRPTQLIFLLCVMTLGIGMVLKDGRSGTVLFTPEDEQAMNWIRENTPSNSKFLINSFIWGDKLMPSDGGGWIQLKTGRHTIYPELGEFYDMCKYMKDNQVGYIYLNKQPVENFFEFRRADFVGISQVVYQTGDVFILSVSCP